MKALAILLVISTVLKTKEVSAVEFSQLSSKTPTSKADEEITESIKNTTEDFEERGTSQRTEDINEPGFDEMFSLLRNILSPFTEPQEEQARQTANETKKDANETLEKHVSAVEHKKDFVKKINCTHLNSSFKHPDYVQIWFMMHLPKKSREGQGKATKNSMEGWIERFFEQILHNFERREGDETATQEADEQNVREHAQGGPHIHLIDVNRYLNRDTEKQQINDTTTDDPTTLSETNESTVDFHMIPETDSTPKATEKIFKGFLLRNGDEGRRFNDDPVNIWSVKDTSAEKRKRSVEHSEAPGRGTPGQGEPAVLPPFMRDFSAFEYNQVRPKRIKRSPREGRNDTGVLSIADRAPSALFARDDGATELPREDNTQIVRQRRKFDEEPEVRVDKRKFAATKEAAEGKSDSAPIVSQMWLAVTLPTVICKPFIRIL